MHTPDHILPLWLILSVTPNCYSILLPLLSLASPAHPPLFMILLSLASSRFALCPQASTVKQLIIKCHEKLLV